MCEMTSVFLQRKPRRALNYSDLRGNIRIDEKSNKSRTSRPNDFAIRSSVAGLGHPFPSSNAATRRALNLTLAAYSSRLIPAKSRSSLILAPNCRCRLVTCQVCECSAAKKMISEFIKMGANLQGE